MDADLVIGQADHVTQDECFALAKRQRQQRSLKIDQILRERVRLKLEFARRSASGNFASAVDHRGAEISERPVDAIPVRPHRDERVMNHFFGKRSGSKHKRGQPHQGNTFVVVDREQRRRPASHGCIHT